MAAHIRRGFAVLPSSLSVALRVAGQNAPAHDTALPNAGGCGGNGRTNTGHFVVAVPLLSLRAVGRTPAAYSVQSHGRILWERLSCPRTLLECRCFASGWRTLSHMIVSRRSRNRGLSLSGDVLSKVRPNVVWHREKYVHDLGIELASCTTLYFSPCRAQSSCRAVRQVGSN